MKHKLLISFALLFLFIDNIGVAQHDNNTNTISESDLKFAEMIQKQHSNAKFNIYTPLDGIYTPFDKNSIPGLLPEIIIKP